MVPHSLTGTPLFGLAVTLGAYAIALGVHRRHRSVHPLFVTCVLLVALLLGLRVPLPDYRIGADLLTLFLGPATVALAVPLYKHAPAIRECAGAIAIALAAGCFTGILSALGCALALRASRTITLSVISKSATTPITMEIARALGGSPEIAATVAVLSGLTGALLAPAVLRACGVKSRFAMGLALGVSSHGIGTASALGRSELEGTYSGLAMALNGILTAAILTPLAPIIQRLL
jgi:predicted murein hydrolase (TIGR00659 family)